MKQLSKHLTFANAISCIALFVALSGAAYAATTTLGKKSVKTQNLANGAVTTLKLRGGSVTNAEAAQRRRDRRRRSPTATVGVEPLANGAVRSEQLGGGVVTSGKLKNGAVTGEKIAGNAVGANQLGPNCGRHGEDPGRRGDLAPSSRRACSRSCVKNVSYVTARASATRRKRLTEP